MNPHCPFISLAAASNDDVSPVVTKHQAEMYLCKYSTKKIQSLGARATLFDVLPGAAITVRQDVACMDCPAGTCTFLGSVDALPPYFNAASGSPGNNPRVPTAEEIVSLYEEAW